MRAIKFRLWDKKHQCHADHDFGLTKKGIIIDIEGYEWQYEKESENYVVEQYTGVKDKHGKEVYENDIIQYPHLSPEEKTVIVKWVPEEAGMDYIGWCFSDLWSQLGPFEIVGHKAP